MNSASPRRSRDQKAFWSLTHSLSSTVTTVTPSRVDGFVAVAVAIQAKLSEAKALLPADVDVVVINDQPAVVDHAIGHFIKEFIVAIIAVMLVTVVLLPPRVAATAAFAIPLTIAATFSVLQAMGIELHQVSLAALIVVLGMVVGNAIVIVDAYVENLDHGMSRWDAAWRSAHELLIPVIAGHDCHRPRVRAAQRVPHRQFWRVHLGSARHRRGGARLVADRRAAVTPLFCMLFIKQGLKGEHGSIGARVLDKVVTAYEHVIRRAVKRPVLTTVIALLTVPASLLLLPAIKQKFFPAAERDQFIVEIDMPVGTRLEATDRVVRQVEELLRSDERIPKFAAFVGTAAPRVYYSFAPEFPRPSYGMLLVSTKEPTATEQLVREYLNKLEHLVPGVRIDVKQFEQGEEYGAPVEVRLVGPELATLREYGDQIRTLAEKFPGATQVRDNFRDGFTIDLQVNNEVANRLGLATSLIATQVRTGFAGSPSSPARPSHPHRRIHPHR